MKRKNKKFNLAFSRFAVPAVLVIALLLMGVRLTAKESVEPVYIEWTVSEGESLWEIAKQHNEPNRDIRSYVSEIAETNQLSQKLIYPGQVLLLPVR